MLWYKSWLETRGRFLICLALLLILACGTVLQYPAVARLSASVPDIDAGNGAVGRLLNEAVELERTYRGYVWLQWFRQNLTQFGTMVAGLLGSGGLIAGSARGTLFTLSLPVSRPHVLGARAATGLGELFVLSTAPSVLIPVLSPIIGQQYPILDVFVHSLCVFVGGAMFFSLALLLSTVFGDVWRPLLITCAIAITLSIGEVALRSLLPTGVFQIMSGASYFEGRGVPWLG